MATDLNIVALVGRLTKNVELKYTSGGMAIANISLAINKRQKVNNEWQEKASFFDCTYFGKSAEAVCQYLTKGKQVSIQGSLDQQSWEKDGQKRSKVVIIVNSLSLLGSKQGSQGQNYNNAPRQQNRQPQEQYQENTFENFQDDIQF